jgi:hypothetical protein
MQDRLPSIVVVVAHALLLCCIAVGAWLRNQDMLTYTRQWMTPCCGLPYSPCGAQGDAQPLPGVTCVTQGAT